MYNVLIVDDSLNNQQILGSIIKDIGYFPILVASGEDALEYIENNIVDIILLDVMMPGIDGFETCKKIKEKENTPVIFITALSQSENISKAYQCGGDDYISKPFVPEEVVARVDNQLTIKKQQFENIQLLDKLNQAEKNDSLNLFSSSISHNFNNIFQIINGNLELIPLYTKDSKVEKCVEDCFSIIDRAKSTLNKVTYYSGDFYTRADDIVLKPYLKRFKTQIDGYLKTGSKFDINYNIESIYLSTDVFKEILENLVINSIESGNVKNLNIEVNIGIVDKVDREYSLDFSNGDSKFLLIKVKDNGLGISEENLKKVFDPYFSTKFIGRGMGLSILYGIVKSQKGMIEINSEVGKGTEVGIYLPFNQKVEKK